MPVQPAPSALVLDQDLYQLLPDDPADDLGVEGLLPYARTGRRRTALKIFVYVWGCPGCHEPLKLIEEKDDQGNVKRTYHCGVKGCQKVWHLCIVTEPGKTPTLALVLKNL